METLKDNKKNYADLVFLSLSAYICNECIFLKNSKNYESALYKIEITVDQDY